MRTMHYGEWLVSTDKDYGGPFGSSRGCINELAEMDGDVQKKTCGETNTHEKDSESSDSSEDDSEEEGI